MLPGWFRAWFTQTSCPPGGSKYFAHCAACLSVLEVDLSGRLVAEDMRSVQEQDARWRQTIREAIAELDALSVALMNRDT